MDFARISRVGDTQVLHYVDTVENEAGGPQKSVEDGHIDARIASKLTHVFPTLAGYMYAPTAVFNGKPIVARQRIAGSIEDVADFFRGRSIVLYELKYVFSGRDGKRAPLRPGLDNPITCKFVDLSRKVES